MINEPSQNAHIDNIGMIDDVYMKCLREFHTKYNHYSSAVPHIPPDNIIELREKLITEETQEFSGEAMAIINKEIDLEDRTACVENVVEVADALSDILYVVFGTALAYGIDIQKCFLEVHRSNMSKTGPNNEYGKTLKGDTWSPPNLRQFIDTPNFNAE